MDERDQFEEDLRDLYSMVPDPSDPPPPPENKPTPLPALFHGRLKPFLKGWDSTISGFLRLAEEPRSNSAILD